MDSIISLPEEAAAVTELLKEDTNLLVAWELLAVRTTGPYIRFSI